MLTRPSTPQLVAIASLTRRPELQPRLQMNEALIEEYREAMEQGAEFPCIDAIELPDGERLLGDGWHRCAGAERAGRTELLTYVWRGSYDDAIEFIAKRNARHGERRTMGDLGKSIKMLRSLAKWQRASNVEIAKHFGLNESTIRRAQSQTAANQPILGIAAEDADQPVENIHPVSGRARRIVHRGGQEYPMTMPPKPEPEPPEAQLARLSAKAKANTAEVVAQDARFRVKRDRALATLSAANVIAWLRQASVKERQQVKAWLDGNA
jgi:hypothetical protein